jgi:hypothetical protein
MPQWLGRLRHLKRVLTSKRLLQAMEPVEVRRTFLQVARQAKSSKFRLALNAQTCDLKISHHWE